MRDLGYLDLTISRGLGFLGKQNQHLLIKDWEALGTTVWKRHVAACAAQTRAGTEVATGRLRREDPERPSFFG